MIDLYTFVTPNGRKVSVALEELGLPYTAHAVHIGKGEQHTPQFRAINPNGKIPAVVDTDGPDGKPITLFESGAILIYLAEKTGQLLPKDPHGRYSVLQWLMFQMGGVGPMFGQFYHFTRFAPEKVPYAIERYTTEAKRLVDVMETALGRSQFLGPSYSIADIATYPWVASTQEVAPDWFEGKPNVTRWAEEIAARPAVARGMKVPQL